MDDAERIAGVVRDPAHKERVAHGVADVLLCLLQLADQAGWTCQRLWSKHCVREGA